MTNEKPTKDNRRFKNFFIAPNQQLRIAIFSVVVGLITLLSFFAFQIWVFSTLIQNMIVSIPESVSFQQMFSDTIQWSWIGFTLGAVFFAVLVSSVTILISHRIYGPMIAIRRHIAAILEGQYDHKTTLRKHDEFKEVAADLNRLSEILREKVAR